MTTRILCVCLGNTCRSPTAHGMLRAALAGSDVTLDSAGTGVRNKVGAPPSARAQQLANAQGYDIGNLRARQFTRQDFLNFDLILVMDHGNLRDVEALRPVNSETPVKLFLDLVTQTPIEVPDPYNTGDYEGAFKLIEAGAKAWANQLQLASTAAPKAT
jgi:protein-tyrosine phosphatase